MNYQKDYTRLASIRPIVLSSSAYRHASGTVFTEGRRTSVTLVKEPDHPRYLFKLGNKQPLFTAENQPNGTRDASTHVDFPCWLTIDGSEIIRLAKKAKLDIALITPEEPIIDHFKVPALDDSADLLDFPQAHLDSYYARPTTASYTPSQFNQDVALLWG